jgi:predicted membrane channel-forming protein YqfA (hemolysin III family)
MYCEGRHKPKFRGIVHFAGTSVIIPLSIMWTCVDINTRNEFIALIIFFTSQFLTWGTSALFHCLSWNLEEEINIQRLGK